MRFLYFFLFAALPVFGTDYYVGPNGVDAARYGASPETPFQSLPHAVNRLSAGDSLFVMDGIYRNSGFGSGIDNPGSFVTLNASGNADAPIVIRNFPEHRPIIETDCQSAFSAQGVSHVVLDGLAFKGNIANISVEEALAYRGSAVPPSACYSGHGIRFKNSHHITVRNCDTYEFCGTGIHVWECDYVTIENNLVYRDTFYNTSATCALVVMTPKSIDESDETKIVIRGNTVFDNMNKVPFYNPNGWAIGPENFGSKDFSEIIDGHGILVFNLPRQVYENQWLYGRILIENNLTFNNGFHGIKTSRIDRVDIRNNVSYKNGASLLKEGTPLKGMAGILVKEGADLSVTGNLIWGLGRSTVGLWAGNVSDTVLDGNVVFGARFHDSAKNTIVRKPEFQCPDRNTIIQRIVPSGVNMSLRESQ